MKAWQTTVLEKESEDVKKKTNNELAYKEFANISNLIMTEHYLLRKGINKKSEFIFLDSDVLLDLLKLDDRFVNKFAPPEEKRTSVYTRFTHLETDHTFMYDLFYSRLAKEYTKEMNFISNVKFAFILISGFIMTICIGNYVFK